MNKEYKLHEIIVEAGQLFQRYGVKSISMEELSRQLGISKKTLYQYFEDKNDLVEKVLYYIMHEQGCVLADLHEKKLNAIEEMFEMYRFARELIRSYNPALEFDLQKFYPAVFKKLREYHRNNMFNLTVQNLTKGKDEGFYRPDIQVDTIAKLFIIRTENMMHSDLVTPDEIHSDKFFMEVFKYHLFGILSKKGLTYVQKNHPEFIH